MENIPAYVAWTFIAIVIAVLLFLAYGFHQASRGKKRVTTYITVTVLVAWIFFISVLSFSDFLQDYSPPPRLMILIVIPVASMVSALVIPKTRAFLMEIPITTLHYLHIIRVPVEMVLFWLSIELVVPKIMTFEGANFDIISGISAPFAAVFMVGTRSKTKTGAIIWNLLALALLANIVFIAISHTPYFYTATAEVPANLGVFFFPYLLLPCFVVPAVLFAHLVSLNQLLFKKDQGQF